MQRRSFLQMTGAGISVLAGGALLHACASGGDPGPVVRTGVELGVQLWTVRDLLRVDVRRTLAAIAATGYKQVEPFGLGANLSADKPFYGLSTGEFAAALAAEGLRAPSIHIDGDAMNIAQIADIAQETGGEYLIMAMAPGLMRVEDGRVQRLGVSSRDQVDRIAARLNEQAEMAHTSGIGFGYHNHEMEFAPLDGGTAYDYLFSQLDAGLVKIQLDLGWVMAAGQDPIELLNRYAHRVVSVHLKDYDPGQPLGDGRNPINSRIVEPGSGPTDFAPILATLDATGVPYRIVEVDLTDEPIAAITRGYDYLMAVRLATSRHPRGSRT